jgi:hypothetical protein
MLAKVTDPPGGKGEPLTEEPMALQQQSRKAVKQTCLQKQQLQEPLPP